MNRQEAQEILLLYRPGRADEDNPELIEALDLVKHDPELAKWFETHCALHHAISAKFKQIDVPAGLKEQILSERKIPSVILWWRRPAVLAAATGVVLLAGLASLWLRPVPRDSFPAFRQWMVRTALRTYTMGLETNDLNQIRAYLAQRSTPADYVLPQSLEKAKGTGCDAMHWHGHGVSMVCFRSGKPLGPGEKSDLFLFVIDRSSVPGAPAGDPPQFTKVNKLMTASWTLGNKVYLLAGNGDEAFLRKFR